MTTPVAIAKRTYGEESNTIYAEKPHVNSRKEYIETCRQQFLKWQAERKGRYILLYIDADQRKNSEGIEDKETVKRRTAEFKRIQEENAPLAILIAFMHSDRLYIGYSRRSPEEVYDKYMGIAGAIRRAQPFSPQEVVELIGNQKLVPTDTPRRLQLDWRKIFNRAVKAFRLAPKEG